MSVPLSLLDLARIGPGETAHDAFTTSVAFARRAEELGFARVWYAEHHNLGSIASSATAVLIAHVAAHTSTIRLGAGGVMLPNHAPLVIAEQFGTLATLHPGRIDLGLGRAPGTDPATLRALRRDPRAAEEFPQDVLELQGYLTGPSRVPGVEALPGRGTDVPLYILGSSLYGAQLAAALGLPYAFASHFAPDALEQAVALYRAGFQPSAQQATPHVIVGVNVVVDEDPARAAARFELARRRRAARTLGRGRELSEEDLTLLLESPAGIDVDRALRCSAVGTPTEVAAGLDALAAHAGADELIVALQDTDRPTLLRSLELLAAERGRRDDAA